MSAIDLTFAISKDVLLDRLAPEIDGIVRDRMAAINGETAASKERRRSLDEALEQAIKNVTRAVARVDNSRHTRDEVPAINALVAAASGLRRAYRQSREGPK
ncbi:hypothetical protein SAMN05892877_12354 [Rhizobium subbaraonis]|uniref:Uncharacterized protein n=1 Tax=Rhizobium subbaraonis TaxID=908946 RepID=A0A285UXR7_9HYPH|nr:hypothetical protein [Rhizobium subbaraonis]SOC46610.1 hypothetical protein SAMN05892877_12354 [Rhizobium subbaraonis]